MPTNQFSPWSGGELQACTNADSPPTAASVSGGANKVPYRQTKPSLTSETGNGSSGRNHWDDARLELPPSSGCYKDLLIQGCAMVQLSSMHETADCFSPPPPLCLSLCKNQGATLSKTISSHNGTKPERSTIRQTNAAQRSSSTKTGIKRFQMPNIQATQTSANDRLLVKDGPPAVLSAATNNKPQSGARLGVIKQALENPCPLGGSRGLCPSPSSSMLAGISAAQHLQATRPDVVEDVTSCPAGAVVGSITTQISAIQLTRQARPASSSSSPSPSPSSSTSPSPTEEQRDGEVQESGSECVMQVDEVDEELHDELENACGDNDDSDCSSAIDASSTASASLLSSVEEPMILGAEDDREARPALVPSLFPLVPPTLYFSTASEKVELLPVKDRRLLKWKMSTVTPNIVKHTIARSHFKVTKKSHDWLGCWGHHMKSPGFKVLGEHQKLNHFPGTFQIGRKDRLWRNLSQMQLHFGKQEFNFVPRTFILPQDIKLLRRAWEDSGSKQKWIVKPPASARGIGIQVIHKWNQMPRKRPLLVQKYLHKPYLIGGNKFDLRIYVYVTSYDPLRIYMFSDGLVRFASCKYSSSMKTLSNKFMHLTNYSVNKKNSEYQTNSDDKACQGHKWALKALWQYLGSTGINTSLIWEKIKDIVIKTVIASEPYVNSLLKMNVKTSYSCHELFGFDIMLDENLKPWILEVNISPSLHSNSALDISIKGQMIRDLLNLAGFRIPTRGEASSFCSSASSSTSSLCGGNHERTKADLCADEKVKRAFYIAQRYAEQDFLSSVLDVLTPEDVRVLAESEDELSRRGEFERVFPSPSSSRYLRFFKSARYHNILLDQWEQKYWNNRTEGISVLKILCEKGIHLGIGDPEHMWSKCSYSPRSEPQRADVTSPSRSRCRVAVRLHLHPHQNASEEIGSDATSVPTPPVSPSPGASVTSSTCGSPQPFPLL
ncbi:tubulin polyglutamylase TTLL4 isoform X2 [Kryptolebias marmoratus]|uniref:Tubulin tyrosine ligase-like family, member 4 n=1 Tax=Kryptolebias marmoratus TaxID=37003 RepID=A0A3Q3ABK3_KRYMA|nr:tubulin polyglutamylase TTLL4 isoform X2 [Kryptolebias marmoratus]